MSPFRTHLQTCCAVPLLLVMCACLSGCATTEFVRLREKPHNPLAERLEHSSWGRIGMSRRTASFLNSSGLQQRNDYRRCLQHAIQQQSGPAPREAAHAVAELSYLGGEHVRAHDVGLASELYLDSAHAAWNYFSMPDRSGTLPDPNASEHRSTAEVYNASCEALLRIAQKYGDYHLGHSFRMPVSRRAIQFEIPFPSTVLRADNLSEFEFVSDYELKNLRNRHTTSGLGVPIIAVRKPSPVPEPIEEYYTEGMSFAATMVLRFPDGVPGRSDQQSIPIRLQAYDPRESDGMVVGQTLLPLETDASTPLARFLSNEDLKLLDTWGLIRPDHARSLEGLYMVQPYDPDRIPVLMVHGLWSSPMTWMEMFNDLQADPELRKHYQFWFYLYPTGEPLAFSAANLRDELEKVRDDCDPHRRNPKLDQMVMVGHSMGGLISCMMKIDSEERLWNSVSQVPLRELPATEEQRNEIHRVFFFRSNPSVSRIVTIASPYGGSTLSNRFTRWLSSTFIWLPRRTQELTDLVFGRSNASWWERMFSPRTSVDSLARESAVLRLISASRFPEDVELHNIIGVSKGTSESDWTDGVVTWQSAHRRDAVSEKIVHAGHSDVQRNPETIAEVRRILKLHLESQQRQRFPVIPIQHQTPTAAASTQFPSVYLAP
ncbi:MAG: alpha/beta fold hydrolase [Planctomycetaceae bacterium]|nr:alpha/beta fold hydrolase [Planctomycetaceae bacterium]